MRDMFVGGDMKKYAILMVWWALLPFGLFAQTQLLYREASERLDVDHTLDFLLKGHFSVTVEQGDSFGVFVSPYIAKNAKIKRQKGRLEISLSKGGEVYLEGEKIRIVLARGEEIPQLSMNLARPWRLFGIGSSRGTTSFFMKNIKINKFLLTYSAQQTIDIRNISAEEFRLVGSGSGKGELHGIQAKRMDVKNSGSMALLLEAITATEMTMQSSGSAEFILNNLELVRLALENSGSIRWQLDNARVQEMHAKSSGSAKIAVERSPMQLVDLSNSGSMQMKHLSLVDLLRVKSSGSFHGEFILKNTLHWIKNSGSAKLTLAGQSKIDLHNSGSLHINDQRYRGDFKGILAIVP
ncbi:GIN domain-containing protein [Entomospira culicis]|nr:DUF2807 domain-containing protein [Entomospira culicis]